ncbi:signal peptidase [Staphylococcus casei]|nr:signal peptidase [Staphylococcus casei]
MILQLLFCPILFSYLYQLCHMQSLKLAYLLLRSRCDYCQQQLKFINMIPILSYMMQRGKTRCCNHKLSCFYIIGELLALFPAFIPTYMTLYVNDATFLLIYLFLLIFSIYDIQTLTLPVHVIMIFIFCGIFITHGNLYTCLYIATLLHIFYFIFYQAIGYGDILLFSILSYLLPYTMFVLTILVTFLIAGLFAFVCMMVFHQANRKIPLVPFIFIAFNFLIIFSESLI